MLRATGASHRFHALFLASAVMLLALACGPAILAPADSTITLTAATTTISISGSTSITATVLAPGGGNVQNGTAVFFATTLGTVNPPQARTQGGKAVAQLLGGSQAGTASVVATSGSAVSDPVQIVIGTRLTVTLSADSTSPAINTVVVFTATTNGPPVDHYVWNFGEPAGGTANTKTTTTGSASYSYLGSGSKTATVTAVASDGTSATAQVTITVQ